MSARGLVIPTVVAALLIGAGSGALGADRAPLGAATPSVSAALAQLASEARRAAPSPQGPDAPLTLVAPARARLSPARLDALIASCAPTTPSRLVRTLVATESGDSPWRLATNGAFRRELSPATRSQAQVLLAGLLAQGANVDIGLMQLNSKTLARMHVAPNEALDPCRNLQLGAQIFDQAYARAMARRVPTSPLWSASSFYNTGDPTRGLRNGYAGRIQAALRTSRDGTG